MDDLSVQTSISGQSSSPFSKSDKRPHSPHQRTSETSNDEQDNEIRVAEQEGPPNKKQRPGNLDIRFLISRKDAGAIIGKGGANINHLRKHYKATVMVPDCSGPERVLTLTTTSDTLADMVRDVIKYLLDDKYSEDKEVELRMLIHTSQAGGIIGRGGEKMKELREETKANFKIFTQCCPESNERVVAITGTVNVVVQAVQSVAQVISSKSIKGPVKLYDPFKASPYRAHDYGGYCELSQAANRMSGRRETDAPLSSHPATSAWDQWSQCAPSGGGSGHSASYPLGSPYARMQQAQNNLRFRSTTENMPYFWSESAFPPADSHHHPASLPPQSLAHLYGQEWQPELEQIVHNSDGSTSATLTVPHNVAGAIIGKGGCRIRIVRRDSGADIVIDNSTIRGDRKVFIKGTRDQVHTAFSMLKQSIAENSL